MEKWEYITTTLTANIKNKGASDYIKDVWPNYKPKEFEVETLIPDLNSWGKDGWELIHFEPVELGSKGDVRIFGSYNTFVHYFLCVFKRRLEG